MTTRNRILRAATVAAVLAGAAAGVRLGAQDGAIDRSRLRAAFDSIAAADLLKHIKVLASDEYEGRSPGSHGEDLTVDYIETAFKAIGVAPGNPDGTYVQKVPLVGIASKWRGSFVANGQAVPIDAAHDYIAVSRRLQPEVRVKDSEIVFVGYGIQAPEYGWDDYKGVDVKGKTIVMLINDPPIPDSAAASGLDEKMFKGRAMTYYGRWTYKYEIASEKGAAAALIVHETGPAGYPWEVVMGSWSVENFDLRRADKNVGRVPVEAWITNEKARELLKAAGQDYDALKKAALRKDFKPVTLPARANIEVRNTLRDVDTRNVIGKLEGSDPQRKSEYVLYTAHWDHLGKDTSLQGDQIYNGAVDNASGVAMLLDIAEAYTKLPLRPARSLLFLALTTEEGGLLGAEHYAEHPLYPLEKTLANINMDGINQWGRTKDIVVIGLGNSTIDDVAAQVASDQQRVLEPDPEPEKGFFYRSDHFELAKKGVPSFFSDAGTNYIGKPAGYGQQKRDEFTERDYHKPSDEVKPDWDLSGGVEDGRFLFELGYRMAMGSKWPEWKPGTEFKATREAALKGK